MLDGIQNHYEAWPNRIEVLHLGKICEKKSSVKTLLTLLLPQHVTVKARNLTTLNPQLPHKNANSGLRT